MQNAIPRKDNTSRICQLLVFTPKNMTKIAEFEMCVSNHSHKCVERTR